MRRYWICSYIITVGFFILGFSVFFLSYARLVESIYDLVMSICYYFSGLFGKTNSLPVTVKEYSQIFNLTSRDFKMPETAKAFMSNFSFLLRCLFYEQNFKSYLVDALAFIVQVLNIIAIVIPIVAILVLILKKVYFIPNEKHNVDTVPLKAFKRLSKLICQPIKGFLVGFKAFLRDNPYIKKSWYFIWILNFNFASIVVAFLAFYFYFAISFDVLNIYKQVVKLLIDLRMFFIKLPVLFILIIILRYYSKWRRGVALSRLNHMERRNCGFINELPIVSMTVGSMGKKKTTIITDMTLSQEAMFRQRAFERLQKQDIKFPFFPWISFEMELKKCMKYKTVYNLATIKEWVRLKGKRYLKHKDSNLQLYGYDVERYGFYYDDELKTETLFDVLESYAKLYFIYVIESSLIVSNYAIRTDNELIDWGNLPEWTFNFFPETKKKKERFSHILDFDVLRLGKKIIEDNPNIGSFEFGVLAITEVGKERGNNLELKEVKKGTDDANQKNDLFNGWLKMCRHSATVDNFPFIKVFTDEQRPESWGSDARDLCDLIHIIKSGEERQALPFYTLEEMVTEMLFNKLIDLYYTLRRVRGDNTLLIHLFKKITAVLYHRHVKIVNRYGYSISTLEKERGTRAGKIEKKKYFLANHKIYSRRFATDCFSDYFNDMARKTKVGLSDYVSYGNERATVEELKRQNSYFIRSLYGTNSD